jgi:zinc D-Ala-D-Ala dipeptidase
MAAHMKLVILLLFFLIKMYESKMELLKLPDGFVYLSDIIPDIQERVRYFTKLNFTGDKLNGYKCHRIIITTQAATSLKNVQEDLKKEGYSLVVYDGYRPQKAVDNFISWSQNSENSMKEYFYPHVEKSKVFDLGYVAKKSGHSRGSTIDLTIIESNKIADNGFTPQKRKLIDGREFSYLEDNTVDMFSSFDLFDEASHHDTNLIPKEFLDRRNYLREKMKKYGFREYTNEWWHYTLENEPYPNTFFDFDIVY